MILYDSIGLCPAPKQPGGVPIDTFPAIQSALERGRSAALATVIRAQGSTPRRPGARMFVDEEGRIAGTVGGGAGEAEVIGAALRAIAERRSDRVTLSMWADEKSGPGMVCGGSMEVLVEALDPERDLAWIRVLVERLGRGEAARVVRRLREGKRAETVVLWIGDAAGETLWTAGEPVGDAGAFPSDGESVHFRTGPGEGIVWLLESVRPPERLVIVGAGHVGEALCEVAARLGFEVHVVDGRPEFAVSERFPRAARVHAGEPAEFLAGLPDDERGSYVLVGHGYGVDAAALRVLLPRRRRYIGMIGSRRRVETVKRLLVEEGFARADLDEVYAPIGLEIEAQTPAEIAISIAAELIAVRHGVKTPAGSISRRARSDEARGGR